MFRLDVLPWDLVREGLFPFSAATRRYAFTQEDLLCLIDRLPLFNNPILLEVWRESFTRSNRSIVSSIEMPAIDRPGFTFGIMAYCFFGMMEWFDAVEGDWEHTYELRGCYLRFRDQPLLKRFFRIPSKKTCWMPWKLMRRRTL